jgi:hypothetical protein
VNARGRLTAVLLVVVTLSLAVVPAHAGLIPDPFGLAKIAALTRIAAALDSTYRFLYRVNQATQSIRNRVDEMFPNETLDEIRSVFQQVRSIQDEVSGLACNWKFSPRVDGLRKGLLKLGPLCRREYQRAFGAPVPGVDADLDEYGQWQAALRWNVVADNMSVSRDWAEAAAELSREARRAGDPDDPNNPHSVGYSQRLLAVSEALRLQIAARENAQEATRLSGLQDDLDRERREDWQQSNLGLQAVLGTEQLKDLPPLSLGERLTSSLGGN